MRRKPILIPDENFGGFPTAKDNGAVTVCGHVDHNHEMQVPGFVARLMWLESMPASKKVAPSGFVNDKKFVDVSGSAKEEIQMEKGGIKTDLRPQKLQRTSVSERQAMTGFGADKLPFKEVLSRSPELPSPVKNPRNLSRTSSSKLIGTATRILEPGPQT